MHKLMEVGLVPDVRTTIRFPEKLWKAMNKARVEEGYQNISELVRAAVREFLTEKGYLDGGESD